MVGQYSTRTMESSPSGGPNKADVSYQINCETTKKGKMFAGTKRRICWKFGFSNMEALQRGLSGADCRGEEHEVVFVWSLTSGKKFVLADGHEVHWSKQSPFAEKFEGSWQCSWHSQMAGANRLLEVVAYTKKSKNNTSVADSSFRNFDLLIDGVPFSEMPQMFELGLTKKLGTSTQQQQQQQQVPRRRKQMHDNELGVASCHSYSSQQKQQQPYTARDTSRTSFSTTDLLYTTSNHSYSSRQQHHSMRDASQNSFSATDLLDFHEQPQQQPQPRVAPLASCNELCSQSMPDLRYGFSMSPSSVMSGSVMSGVESVPHFHYQHQQPSPTSVMSSNPFDVYATATKPFPPPPQQPMQHQIRAQYQTNTYTPYPQQQQRSTVY